MVQKIEFSKGRPRLLWCSDRPDSADLGVAATRQPAGVKQAWTRRPGEHHTGTPPLRPDGPLERAVTALLSSLARPPYSDGPQHTIVQLRENRLW